MIVMNMMISIIMSFMMSDHYEDVFDYDLITIMKKVMVVIMTMMVVVMWAMMMATTEIMFDAFVL